MHGVFGHNGAYRAMPTLCKDRMSALDRARSWVQHLGYPLSADVPSGDRRAQSGGT